MQALVRDVLQDLQLAVVSLLRIFWFQFLGDLHPSYVPKACDVAKAFEEADAGSEVEAPCCFEELVIYVMVQVSLDCLDIYLVCLLGIPQ